MENETRVAIKPGTNVGVFVSKNDVDDLADRNLRLDGVQKSNEPMTVPSRTLRAANSVVVPCRL